MSDGRTLRKSGPIGRAMTSGPTGSSFSSKLYNANARELPVHNEGTNTQQKVTGSTNIGGKGAKGHGGAA